MAGETKSLQFSEGTSVTAPTQSFIPSTKMLPYASDAAYVTAKGSAAQDGDHYFNSVTNAVRLYYSAAWHDWGTGAGVGGGAQYTTVLAGESIDGDTGNPMAVCISQRKCIYIAEANSYIDVNEGSGEIRVKCLTNDQHFLISDIGFDNSTEDLYNLAKVIENALNNHVSTTLTYTCTYSKTTRKITIAASNTFSLLWNTGTDTAANLGVAIGFSIAADDTGSSTYTADAAIDNSSNTSYVDRAFVTKTDASLIVKSRNFDGFITDNKTKGETCTVKQFSEIDGFSGLNPGDKYYTLSSKIVIDTTNHHIDFKEGAGAEINVILTSGTYYRGSDTDVGYASLCADIKAQMDASSGAGVFTVVFDKNTNKFTISSTVAFTLLFGTGTNVATSARTVLGYASSDTTNAVSHTSSSVIPSNTGVIGTASNSGIVSDSRYVGKAIKQDGTSLFCEKNFNVSDYDPIYESPGDFFTTPSDKDFSEEMVLQCQQENASGKGVRVFCTTTSPATYKIQYKNGDGLPWTDATTTIARGYPAATTYDEDHGGEYSARGAKCFIDASGYAVIAVIRRESTSPALSLWIYYSSNLDTWTAVGGTHVWLDNVLINAIFMNENLCVVYAQKNDSSASKVFISENTGSGYTSFSETSIATNCNMQYQSSAAFIQYFSGETGVNKYRVVCIGKDNANPYYINSWHCKKDGSGATLTTIFSTSSRYLNAATMDTTTNKIIVFISAGSAGAAINAIDSNTTYNSNVISWDSHTSLDINSGGSGVDSYVGYSSADEKRYGWCVDRRAVLIGNYCYFITNTNANAGSKSATMLFYSKNVSGGVWETPVNVGGAQNNQESQLAYIPSVNSLLVTWKYLPAATLANNLTNGQIFAKLIALNADGSISQYDAEQIDGLKSEANFAGLHLISSSQDSVSISWEQYNGATRDTVKSNYLV